MNYYVKLNLIISISQYFYTISLGDVVCKLKSQQ